MQIDAVLSIEAIHTIQKLCGEHLQLVKCLERVNVKIYAHPRSHHGENSKVQRKILNGKHLKYNVEVVD